MTHWIALSQRASDHDHMPLHGIDHLELWVGNAAQAAYVFTHAYGFTEIAYAGLETGLRDCTSHVLQQGRIRLVVTGALGSVGDIAAHHARARRRREGHRAVVPDVAAAYREATARGARGLLEPSDLYDEHGTVRLADIAAYGDTVHRFVDRADYDGPFLPGYVATPHGGDPAHARLLAGIDHVVGNVELGAMDRWVKYYEDVFGMTRAHPLLRRGDLDRVLGADVEGRDERRRAGEVPDQRAGGGQAASRRSTSTSITTSGPGAQHIALSTRDIVATVEELSATRRRVPPHAGLLLRRSCPSASARSTSRSTTCAGSASLSTATTRATCCRSSRSRSATGRRSSSRSSSATARAASARATSRPCSRRSSASRRGGGTSDALRVDGRRPAQAPHAVPRRGRPAARRGGDGLRGLLRQRVDPLPPALAVPTSRRRRLHTDRARGVGPRRARAPPHRHGAAATRRRPGLRPPRCSCSTTTSRSRSASRDGARRASTETARATRSCSSTRARGSLRDDLRRAAVQPPRLRRDPARNDLPGPAGRRPRRRGSRSTPPARSRRPTATATATASCSSTRRSRSATSTRRRSSRRTTRRASSS